MKTAGVGAIQHEIPRDWAQIDVPVQENLIGRIMEVLEHYRGKVIDVRQKFTLANQTIGEIEECIHKIPGTLIEPLNDKIHETQEKLRANSIKLGEIFKIARNILIGEKAALKEGESLNSNLLLLEQALHTRGKLLKASKTTGNHPFIFPDTVQLNESLRELSDNLKDTMVDAYDPAKVTDYTSLGASIMGFNETFKRLSADFASLVRPTEHKLSQLESQVEKHRSTVIPVDHIGSIARCKRVSPATILAQLEQEKAINAGREERHDKLAEAYANAQMLMEQVKVQIFVAEIYANILHDVKGLLSNLSEIKSELKELKKQTRKSVLEKTFETRNDKLNEDLKIIIDKYNAASELGNAYRENAERTIKDLQKMMKDNGLELRNKLSELNVFNKELKVLILKVFEEKTLSQLNEVTNLESPLRSVWQSVVELFGSQEAQKPALAYIIDRTFYAINEYNGTFPKDKTYGLPALFWGWKPESKVLSPFAPKPVIAAAAPAPAGEDIKLKGEAEVG